MHRFKNDHFEMYYADMGVSDNADAPIIVWGHGWGHSHESFLPLVQTLAGLARHVVVDFPGFGRSPVPFEGMGKSWGSADYAHAMADFIRATFPGRKIIWAAHSFGGRVGTQLAALYPELVEGMIFIAGAGLQPKRSLFEKLRLKAKVFIYKVGKKVSKTVLGGTVFKILGISGDKSGSSDYQNAGPMRGVLVRVVNEHLAEQAKQVSCPVLLIYGGKDTAAPVNVGQQFCSLIKGADLVVLPDDDHYSMISVHGVHQVAMRIKLFLQNV